MCVCFFFCVTVSCTHLSIYVYLPSVCPSLSLSIYIYIYTSHVHTKNIYYAGFSLTRLYVHPHLSLYLSNACTNKTHTVLFEHWLADLYGDIPHDVTAWTFPDSINSDWLDKQVKWVTSGMSPADALKEPIYGTRPCCRVQAITRHTCPDPHLGSWNCLPHQAHIAPSEPMSSIDQLGSSLGSFSISPSPLSPL